MSKLMVGSNLCQCGACGEHFKSPSAFDKHRTGDQEARRCLTPDEMREAGMALNEAGFWVGQVWDEKVWSARRAENAIPRANVGTKARSR